MKGELKPDANSRTQNTSPPIFKKNQKQTIMYKAAQPTKTTIKLNNAVEGETIEVKVRRITTQREPIRDGAPLLYTERKEGVPPETNIRSDRFEIAVENMDKVSADKIAKREERAKAREGQAPTDAGGEQGGV